MRNYPVYCHPTHVAIMIVIITDTPTPLHEAYVPFNSIRFTPKNKLNLREHEMWTQPRDLTIALNNMSVLNTDIVDWILDGTRTTQSVEWPVHREGAAGHTTTTNYAILTNRLNLPDVLVRRCMSPYKALSTYRPILNYSCLSNQNCTRHFIHRRITAVYLRTCNALLPVQMQSNQAFLPFCKNPSFLQILCTLVLHKS